MDREDSMAAGDGAGGGQSARGRKSSRGRLSLGRGAMEGMLARHEGGGEGVQGEASQ